MNRSIPLFTLILLVLPPAASAQIAGEQARRARILEIAERYRKHRWRASKRHVKHGEDPDGIRVDTPDRRYRKKGWRPGRTNTGLPYMWGGFSTIEAFDEGLRAGKFAGHLPKGRGAKSSRHAVGLDCSGFVSRCWGLPIKQSTRSLGRLCYRLESHEALKPGDVMNRHNGHVVLFKSFADRKRTRLRVIEAGGTRVHQRIREIADLREQRYVPLRYKPLDPRWKNEAVRFEVPTWSRPTGVRGRFVPDGKRLDDLASLPVPLAAPLAAARAGDWVTLDIRVSHREAGATKSRTQTLALGAAGDAGRTVRVHRRLEEGRDSIDAVTPFKTETTALETILALIYHPALRRLEVESATLETGTYEMAGEPVAAVRLRCEVTGVTGWSTPAKARIDCVLSATVPLVGLLEGTFAFEAAYPGETVGIEREVSTRAFRRGPSPPR